MLQNKILKLVQTLIKINKEHSTLQNRTIIKFSKIVTIAIVSNKDLLVRTIILNRRNVIANTSPSSFKINKNMIRIPLMVTNINISNSAYTISHMYSSILIQTSRLAIIIAITMREKMALKIILKLLQRGLEKSVIPELQVAKKTLKTSTSTLKIVILILL